MIRQARQALAAPIFDPLTYDASRLCWWVEPGWSAILSVNIGLE